MTLEEEIVSLNRSYAECWARYLDRIVIIEFVYEGRGGRRGTIRAKVFDDTRVKHVDFFELNPF